MEGGSEHLTQKIEEDAINGQERGGGGGEKDEEFYEQIEAPKFVDFTIPDAFRPDDRFWFCSRVGCDQKHEEEIDPEEISKNFVLRVMAARSPNIKLRRALYGKCSSMNNKCPLSAPAKSSKPKISRLAMVSSISNKLVDPKVKVGLPSLKLSSISTSIAKSKQVAAKYMTTPRRTKSILASTSFQSVQNPKPTSVLVPKSRLVAKALVFHSPKKGISVKRSVELHTSITKICEGMKRLEVTSQKKSILGRILGHSSKSSKDIRSSSKKPFPKDHSGRRMSIVRGRRVSFLKAKGRSKESLFPRKSNDREAKSFRGIKTNGRKMSNDREAKSFRGTKTDGKKILTNQTAGHCPSTTKTKPKYPGVSKTNEDVQNAEHPTLGITKNSSPDDAKIIIDNDDKENVLTVDVNRDNNCKNNRSGNKVLGSQDTLKSKKVARVVDKNLKDGLFPATVDPILVKYKKPKLTNPKPFRLRTDERGILKEANLDRKLHFAAPQNEGAKDSAFSDGNSKRTHGKVSGGSCQKVESVSRAIKRETKYVTSPLRNGKTDVTPKSEINLTRTRSLYLKEKLVTPQRVASTRKAKTCQRVIIETLETSKPYTIPKEPNFHCSHMSRVAQGKSRRFH